MWPVVYSAGRFVVVRVAKPAVNWFWNSKTGRTIMRSTIGDVPVITRGHFGFLAWVESHVTVAFWTWYFAAGGDKVFKDVEHYLMGEPGTDTEQFLVDAWNGYLTADSFLGGIGNDIGGNARSSRDGVIEVVTTASGRGWVSFPAMWEVDP